MQAQPLRPNMAMALIGFSVLFGVMLACARVIQTDNPAYWSVPDGSSLRTTAGPGEAAISQQTRDPNSSRTVPTPDPPHPLPALRADAEVHTVQAGDTLGQIAKQYGVSLDQLVTTNGIADPNLLEVGQVLQIPVPTPEGIGPDFKIIPDSELIYSPSSTSFDIAAFVHSQGGYLAAYRENVYDQSLTGAQVLELVARDYSVSPRLLLAVLQYQSGWVTRPAPADSTLDYPMGYRDQNRKGLYRQLAWAANNLNRGYYLWRVNGVSTWLLTDNRTVPINPVINAGTAGVQGFFALLYDQANWQRAISAEGLFATYDAFFGYPFDYTYEPIVPAGLQQPKFQLPFEAGKDWAFTGGPHGGWGDGSAWAALDFAPPSDALGCVQSNEWVVAIADGLVLRSENGVVIQDLDGDGLEQTGWVIVYMHIETRDRVAPGVRIKVGDQIGHPSCEGGVSTGTHVHIARKYNGEWIAADQEALQFVMDSWVSSGNGFEYNGFMQREGISIEAYAGRSPNNGIQR